MSRWVGASVVLSLIISTITGCGGAVAVNDAANAPRWETKVLANGVELRVRDDASPDAVRTAEDIQSEMRSRYLSARQ